MIPGLAVLAAFPLLYDMDERGRRVLRAAAMYICGAMTEMTPRSIVDAVFHPAHQSKT
jgi:hypothetical protein